MKIKNIIQIVIMAAVAMFASVASVSAQNHPSSLPHLRGEDALRNYVLSIAATGGRYVYANTMDWSDTNSVTQTSTNGGYGEEILKRLFSVPFSYRVINPDDYVRSYVYLYDTNNTLLLYGYGEAIANTLTTNKIFTRLYQQNVPILSDVEFAEILILGADGQTADRYSVEVDRFGRVLFPAWMAGYENAILSIRYTDGTIYTYNLSSPIADSPDIVYQTDEYGIDGHYQITSASIKGAKLKIMETWNLPTAFLDLSVSQDILIDVSGLVQDGRTYFERPTSMEVTDSSGIVTTVVLDTTDTSSMRFPTGTYRLKFNWVKFGQRGMLYTSIGGKG